MTIDSVLGAIQQEHRKRADEFRGILKKTESTPSILHLDFYQLADEIREAQDLAKIVESSLTSEKSKQDPFQLLKIWKSTLKALIKIAPELHSSTKQLNAKLDKLLKQEKIPEVKRAESLTAALTALKPHEEFCLLSPKKNSGLFTSEVVVYRRNNNNTYDILLFHADVNSWIDQSGEFGAGYEKSYSLKHYSQIPKENLWGPDYHTGSMIHAKQLFASSQSDQGAAFMAAFEPFESYRKSPIEEQIRAVRMEHAHPFKSLYGFLEDQIQHHVADFPLEYYKAFIGISRLLQCVAVFRSLAHEDKKNLYNRAGLLKESIASAARALEKNKDNRFIKKIYEEASGTLYQLFANVEKINKGFVEGLFLGKAEQSENQKIFIQAAQDYCKSIFQQELFCLPVEDKPTKLNQDLVSLSNPPKDPSDFIKWLDEAHLKLRDLNNSYPDLTAAFLNALVSKFPLPDENSPWLHLDEQQRLKTSTMLTTFSETNAVSAFQSNHRFSLEVQNTGAKLLIIAHQICAKSDKKQQLVNFFPSLKGYKNLSKSPYFQCYPLSAWREREQILQFIGKQKGHSCWNFYNKRRDSFDKTPDGQLAKSLLDAYPDLAKPIDKDLQALRKSSDRFEFFDREHLLIAELLEIKIVSDLEQHLDLRDPFVSSLSNLAKTAMHVHLLSDPRARSQVGTSNSLDFRQGILFNLTYARNQEQSIDFQKNRLFLNQKTEQILENNLQPKFKHIHCQNETISRLSRYTEEEKQPDSYIFEEAAAEPHLTVPQLLNSLKNHPELLQKTENHSYLLRYLFKALLNKEENFPLLKEIITYPSVFTQVLKEFLEGTNSESGSLQELTFRLWEMAKELSCEPLDQYLNEYFKKKEHLWKFALVEQEKNESSKITAQLLINLLKVIQPNSSFHWENYFEWGTRLQNLIEQKEITLTPQEAIWWSKKRLQMAQIFFESKNSKGSKNLDKDFDLLTMSYHSGKTEAIPQEIVEHPEFKRLFSDRVRYWKYDNEQQYFIFRDEKLGVFYLKDIKVFPTYLLRWINDEGWHYYISPQDAQKSLHLPSSISQNSTCWINGNTQEVLGYFREQPEKLWFKMNEGVAVFQSGKEKEKRLELTQDEEFLDSEFSKTAFGMHYYAVGQRFKDPQINSRHLLVFPNIRILNGKNLIFERLENEFIQKGNPNRKLGNCLFSPGIVNEDSFKVKSSPIKVYGIQIENTSGISQTSILLPFQKHTSEAHSCVVYSLSAPLTSHSKSLFKSIDVIEIKINVTGFMPEKPLEYLFAAYISLVGKDYFEAHRFLKQIRPNHYLTDQEKQIVQWLIDSAEEAQDHSAQAAAIKLRAYQLLGDQGLSVPGVLDAPCIPKTSLEDIYLCYLNHTSSVPNSLIINFKLQSWILNRGFELFPPLESSSEMWKRKREDLQQNSTKVQVSSLIESDPKDIWTAWSEPITNPNIELLEFKSALVDGIIDSFSEPLIPGEFYPLKSFGSHYKILSSRTVNKQMKWELIYAIETTNIHHSLKIALKIAFQKGNAAPQLPDFTQVPYYESVEIFRKWLSDIISTVKIEQKPSHLIQSTKVKPIVENRHFRHEPDRFSQKVHEALERAHTSPFEIIKSIQKEFIIEKEAYEEFPIDCPFQVQKTEDDLFTSEVHLSQQEWKKGLEALKNSKQFKVPDLDSLHALNAILESYPYRIDLESLTVEIRGLLNRKPIDPKKTERVYLDEILGHKTEMDLDDALKTILILTDEAKLKFLNKRNPFLNEMDLVNLKRYLKNYLELSVVNHHLKNVKIQLDSLLKCTSNKQWKLDPTVQVIWQEIGLLLDPLMDYQNQPLENLERLLFEHLSGFSLRKEQVDILSNTLKVISSEDIDEKMLSVIFQLKPGAGKTDTIIRLLIKIVAMKGKVPFVIAHHSQYASLKATFMDSQHKKLRQDVMDIDFDRNELSDIKVLKFILNQLKEAKDKKRALIMKSNFLIILRLELTDQIKTLANAQNLDPLTFERVKEISKIFSFLRQNGIIIADELDCILNVLDEINFSSGLSKIIKETSLNLIKQIYLILSTHAEITSLLKLQDNQSLVSKKKLISKIFPTLVDALIDDYPPLSTLIPPLNFKTHRECLKDYLLGKIDPRLKDSLHVEDDESFLESLKIPAANKDLARQHLQFLRYLSELKLKDSSPIRVGLATAGLMKELSEEILSNTLEKSRNKHFGFNEDGKAIPFLGVDTPNQTEFANIYETACSYFQASLEEKVSLKRLYEYRDKMQESASYNSKLLHCSPDETIEAQHFTSITNLPLYQEWSEEDINNALKSINLDPQRCLDFYAEFASLHLRYHTSLLNCGPLALTSMASTFVGCSATLWNKDTYPREIAAAGMEQEGDEGKVNVKLARDIASGKSHLITIKDPVTPQSILSSIISKRGVNAADRLKALIDVGWMLRRYLNEQVAREILDFQPLKEKIKAVVFLKREGNSEYFAILKRGSNKSEPLRVSTFNDEMRKNGFSAEHELKLDEIFVYYDDLRTRGSHFLLKPDALGVFTFNPFDTPTFKVTQGLLRERGFLSLQNADIVCHEDALEGLENYSSIDPLASLTAKNFFLTASRNQANLKKNRLLKSALDQLQEIYASSIVQQWVERFSKCENEPDVQSIELFKISEKLFHISFDDDPIAQFLDLKKQVLAKAMVQKRFEDLEKFFQEKCSPYFDDEKLKEIRMRANRVVKWANEKLTWLVTEETANSRLGVQAQMELQTQNQLQVDLEIQKEVQRELQKYSTKIDAPFASHILFEKLKEVPSSFSDYKKPPLMTFSQLLQKVDYEAPYQQIFPNDLYVTENFSRSLDLDLPVFHPTQKSAKQILIVKENDQYRPIFLDLKEAAFWREQIQKYALEDCWLYDIDGHCLNENTTLPSDANSILLRAQWWGHFFNGNASFLRSYPSYMKKEFQEVDHDLKYRFLLLKAANNLKQSKILTMDPAFREKEPLESVFTFINKEEEEEWISKEIKGLSEDEINQLPFHFARYLSKEQIPLIKRKGYLSYLLPKKFRYLTSAQLSLIPDFRLQYLTLPEHIQSLPEEKIYFLKGAALQHVKEDLIERMNPEEIIHLKPEDQKRYQEKMIERHGLQNFSAKVTSRMAPVILPGCVPFLNDHCLSSLCTIEQLQHVCDQKIQYLRAKQFHLLDARRWDLLKKQDYEKFKHEKNISDKSEALIKQISPEWINELDPRLAKYYSQPQIENISNPKLIEYLNTHQLLWLDPLLAEYLDSTQLALLTSEHESLISHLKDPRLINQLSYDALKKLSPEQVILLNDREKLILLEPEFYSHLLPSQLKLLDHHCIPDQKIIKNLLPEQIKGLDTAVLELFVPYLNSNKLHLIEPLVLAKVKNLSTVARQNLSSLQLQCHLSEQQSDLKYVYKVLKELTDLQWEKLEETFIKSFFKDKPKPIVKLIPKKRVSELTKTPLLKWFNADKRKANDFCAGLFSVMLYPLLILSGILIGVFGRPTWKEWKTSFRRVAISPLRFFSREAYYRLLSTE